MITKAESIPTRSDKGKQGQDLLWTQFNDVSFFIEDDYQENLYFQILKKLFPDIKISKIFPLGGKKHVLKKAKKSLHTNRRVFIVDNDFDEILNNKETLPNLFYLQRYSIENYLFEQDAIFEIIREENPKITIKELKSKFNLSHFLTKSSTLFSELSAHLLLIMKYELEIGFLKIDPHRDCDFSSDPHKLKPSCVGQFYKNVEVQLKKKRTRLRYITQLKFAVKNFKKANALNNIPGKYLANYLRVILKKTFSFTQCSNETFMYRLMKNCDLSSLSFLKDSINLYTKLS